MPRSPLRLLPVLALVTLAFFSPTLATALPQSATLHSATEHPAATSGLFAKFWGLLSAVWVNGSGLDPDGPGSGPSSETGTEPSAATGDNGSGLEPNG